MKNIILASKSPRRYEILKAAGINFKIEAKDTEEETSSLYNEKIIINNSQNKVLAVFREDMEPSLIIGADTVVILDSVCLVKPHSIYEALFMLKKLSNKTHMVVTAHTIFDTASKKMTTELSKSFVTFRKLNLFEILFYIILKNPLDKAGSYGIQDFIKEDEKDKINKKSFISKLEGSYYNVMGLDIELVLKMLLNF